MRTRVIHFRVLVFVGITAVSSWQSVHAQARVLAFSEGERLPVAVRFMAKGEFDGDPSEELAIVSSNSSGVYFAGVFDPATDPTFLRRFDTALGELRPLVMHVADFDRDSLDDVCVVLGDPLPDARTLVLLYATGDGGLREGAVFETPYPIRSLAHFDLIGDARPELIFGHQDGIGAVVDLESGTVEELTTGAVATVRSADLNGDGRADLLASTGLVLLSGATPDSIRRRRFFPKTSLIGVGDFDGDDDLDLMQYDATVRLGNGDGGFAPAFTSRSDRVPLSRMVVADFDSDGRDDIVGDAELELVVCRGNGDGTFQAPMPLLDGRFPRAPIVGIDLDGDGLRDVLVADRDQLVPLHNRSAVASGTLSFAEFSVGARRRLSEGAFERWSLPPGDATRTIVEFSVQLAAPRSVAIAGWTLALRFDPGFELESATVAGTAADVLEAGGFRDPDLGDERSVLLDDLEDDGSGLVSVVRLGGEQVLPESFSGAVLRIRGSIPTPEETQPPCGGASEGEANAYALQFVGPGGAPIMLEGVGYRCELLVDGNASSPLARSASVEVAHSVGPRAAFSIEPVPDTGWTRYQSNPDDPQADSAFELPVDPEGEVVPFPLRLLLNSAIPSCNADPLGPCFNGEAFQYEIIEDDSVTVYRGCDDGIDNDGDGLTDADDPECSGIRAWSVVLEADPCLQILSARIPEAFPLSGQSTRPSTPEPFFERTEFLDPDGVDTPTRVFSSVILDPGASVTLPHAEASTVLLLEAKFRSEIPDVGRASEACVLQVLPDTELQSTTGAPAITRVSFGSEDSHPGEDSNGTIVPRTCSTALRMGGFDGRPTVSFDTELLVPARPVDLHEDEGSVWILHPSDAGRDTPFRAEIGVVLQSETPVCSLQPGVCSGGERVVVENSLGERVYGCNDQVDNDGDGRVDIEDMDCRGVAGWSFSLELDPCFSEFIGTTSGTVAAENDEPPGLRTNGFRFIELVPPRRNDGRTGLNCSVWLSFTDPVVLPPVSRQTVLRVLALVEPSPLGIADDCSFRVIPPDEPGLRDSHGNRFGTGARGFTSDGGVGAVLHTTGGRTGTFRFSDAPFIRGDTSADGQVDISDAIHILNGLFRSDTNFACRDAADVTDDQQLDLSDAISLLNFLFLNGPEPAAPLRECGADPTPDSLGCRRFPGCE